MCFYSLKEYKDHVQKGYEMYLTFGRFKRHGSITDLEIELRKKK